MFYSLAESFSQQMIDVVVAINQLADCQALGLDVERSIIYPIPASSFLKLPLDVTRFHLPDASGREYQVKYNNQDQKIDASELKEGIYFLHLISKGNSKIWKVKIERR